MKFIQKPILISLCAIGVMTSAFAVTEDQTVDSHHTVGMSVQMPAHSSKKHTKTVSRRTSASNTNVTTSAATQTEVGRTTIDNLPDMTYLPIDLDAPGQSFVTSGPYIGLPIQYAGGDLIINTPSINNDVTLLKVRKKIIQRLQELGQDGEHYHSHILLSGNIEAQAYYRDMQTTGSTQSDIDLTNAELDAFILGPSSWTSGYVAFTYDNDPSEFANERVENSRLFVNKAFLMFGDFTKSPFYGSIGQMYVPFGAYHTNMISSPFTKIMARTLARALNIGYQGQEKSALFTSAYIFKGASYSTPTNASRVNNGGIQLGYRYRDDRYDARIGTGVIGNIADSLGMQDTGNSPLFDGFGGGTAYTTNPITGAVTGASTGNELLVHRVPAYDLRGLLGIGDHWDFLAEYITASTHFNPNDMTFDGSGAKPQALNAEAAYTFTILDNKPSTVAVGYGMTHEALALGLPRQRYIAVFNTSLWRDTLEGIEFRHDMDYSASSTSSGSDVTGPTGTGRSNNIVTAQVDLYF